MAFRNLKYVRTYSVLEIGASAPPLGSLTRNHPVTAALLTKCGGGPLTMGELGWLNQVGTLEQEGFT